jgi:hypothetical protein
MKSLLLFALLTVRLLSAAPGEVYITPDNTGTNAYPGSVGTNLVILLVGTSADGSPFATIDGVLAHTFGNIFEVNNGGAPALSLNYQDQLTLFGNDGSILIDTQNGHGRQTYLADTGLETYDNDGEYTAITPWVNDGTLAYLFNTFRAHTSGPLAEFQNNGTNELILGFNGRLFLGNQAFVEWPTKDFVIERDASTGDGDTLQTYWETIDSQSYNQNAGLYTFFASTSNSVASRIILQAVDTGTASQNRSAEIDASHDRLAISLSAEGTTYALINPSAANGITPFSMGTLSAHTTGNLLALSNGGTSQLIVDTSTTANDIRLEVYDVTAGSVVRVTRGAADSGGTGRRVLTVPN